MPELFIVIHLMIAGRLRWKPPGTALGRKLDLAAFDFPEGRLVLTEAGSKKRANIHLVRGEAALAEHDRGGLEVFEATRATLDEWTRRLRDEVGEGFPEKVTAFRPEMAVHGRYRKPCPVCGSPVQRIVHAASEVNYCATCQTGGKLLKDRALSRLLRGDWPKTVDELEKLRRP